MWSSFDINAHVLLQNPDIIGSILHVECIFFFCIMVTLARWIRPSEKSLPEIHGVDLWQVYDQDLYKLDTRNITVNK